MQQSLQTEAAIESLAESLFNNEQLEDYKLRKFEIIGEKLAAMTDQVQDLIKDFEK